MIRVCGIDLADGYWWTEVREGAQPEDSVCLELWAEDKAKNKAYQDAVRALAEVVGLLPAQIIERLWAKRPGPSASFWCKRVATAWFARKLVEGCSEENAPPE